MKEKEMKHSKEHPGFDAIVARIMREKGVSKESAQKILASSTRNASPEAKRKNPRLNRVKG